MGKDIFSGIDTDRGLGIIQGWKEIGRYLGRSGRTARRWYDRFRMPIRYSGTGHPFIFIFELDKWMVLYADALKKDKRCKEEREQKRQHCAMMRSCKRKGKCTDQQKGESYGGT